ncbi:MAG: 4Fe-4S single cluster domain-containing protein [Pyrinomonadaceae bacterium]
MKNEITFIVEPDRGRVTLEISGTPKRVIAEFEKACGKATEVNCGKPYGKSPVSETRKPAAVSPRQDNSSIWLYRLYHNSVVDGPGRRSVVQVAGCSIRCKGCYVPETHEHQNGSFVSISSIVDEIVSKRSHHDGVTILGGEPFDQPGPVAELVHRLKKHNLHIMVYSGHKIETLIARKDPNTDYILTHSDALIDGPFIYQQRDNASEYRGSRNQRQFVNLGRVRYG